MRTPSFISISEALESQNFLNSWVTVLIVGSSRGLSPRLEAARFATTTTWRMEVNMHTKQAARFAPGTYKPGELLDQSLLLPLPLSLPLLLHVYSVG